MKYNKEVFEKVNEVLSQYDMTEPMIGPVLEVRVPVTVTKEDGARPPIYVQFGFLTEPIFIIGDESFRPIPALDEIPQEIAFDLVWDALRVWMKEFQRLSDKTQLQNWAWNYDAMQTIYNSIEDAREYNVYVPFLDANFSNEATEEGEDEKADGSLGVYDFATLLNDLAFYYDKKEQREKENTSKAIDKLKAVQEKLFKEKLAVKACNPKSAGGTTTCRDVPAPEGVKFDDDFEKFMNSVSTRKLRLDLKALKKYRPEVRQLDVAGWVVTVKRNARGRYFVKFPWVGNELNKDELDMYATAKKDKKCPVAWELIYLINKTLQEL